ncbi:MAG: hypothetical protein AAF750_03715 [Planctomycetota bacterium]
MLRLPVRRPDQTLEQAGQTMPTQADRGAFYHHFSMSLIESRCCVGWQWFKHLDNDPTDPDAEPSSLNSNKGVVTASYEPYADLFSAMGVLHTQAYALCDYFDRVGDTTADEG